jgi:hypothetical protein
MSSIVATASDSAELTFPRRKLTLSRSMSLRAFCTAVPAELICSTAR